MLKRESEVKIDSIWRIHGMLMNFKLILQCFIEEDIKKIIDEKELHKLKRKGQVGSIQF